MKHIKFSPEEKDLLLSAIKKRYADWQKEGVPDKQLNRITDIEREVKYKLSHIKDSQKGLLRGIIQEHILDSNQEKIDEYKYRDNMGERTNSQKEEITKFNSYITLKNKLLPKADNQKLIQL